MANETTVTTGLSCTKSGTSVNGSQTKQITLAGTGEFANTQLIGTAAELIAYPSDLTTEGITFIYFKNDDATNFIEIALDNFTNKFAKLLPGESMILKSHTASPTHYAKADTAACVLRIVAVGT